MVKMIDEERCKNTNLLDQLTRNNGTSLSEPARTRLGICTCYSFAVLCVPCILSLSVLNTHKAGEFLNLDKPGNRRSEQTPGALQHEFATLSIPSKLPWGACFPSNSRVVCGPGILCAQGKRLEESGASPNRLQTTGARFRHPFRYPKSCLGRAEPSQIDCRQ